MAGRHLTHLSSVKVKRAEFVRGMGKGSIWNLMHSGKGEEKWLLTPSNHRVGMNVGCLYLHIPPSGSPNFPVPEGLPFGTCAGGQVQDAHWSQGTEELVLPSLEAPSQNSSKCNIVLYRRDFGAVSGHDGGSWGEAGVLEPSFP